MLMLFRKIPIVAVLAVLVGLAVFGYSYYKSGGLIKPAQAYITIPVPITEISAYTTITKDIIVLKEYVQGTEPSGVITEPGQLIDKIAVKNLHKDVPITTGDISTLNNLPDLVLVGINIDAARAAGAQQGDIVDVYRVKSDQTGQTTAMPVALNARVVEICDATGKPVNTQFSIAAVGESFKSPTDVNMIYRLLIKPEEVGGVISGGAPKDTSIALAKKFKETTATPPVNATTNPTVKGAKN